MASLTSQGSALTVATPELSLSLQGPAVQALSNLLTGEPYIKQAGPGWFDMNLQTPTGAFLQPGVWQLSTDSTGAQLATLVASDSARQVTITIGTDPVSNEIFIRLQGNASRPGVRSLFFGMQGFDPLAGKFVLPAHAGVTFDANTNPPALAMQYPTHWEAGFAIYQTAKGGVLLYARDPHLYYKQVQATRQLGTLDIGFETFAVAPFTSATAVPQVEWRLKAFQGDWKQAVDFYKTWSTTVLPLRQAGADLDWVKQIGAVITIINPDPSYLNALAAKLVPSKTLLYLVNWRKDDFDVNYPDYTPGTYTPAFVAAARQLGFRIMLHTNAIGVSTYNPVYASVSRFQLRDADTKDLEYWPWGLWPAGPPPPAILQSFAFISPCSSTFRSMFIDALRPMMAELKPDAIHLDAGGVMLNDGNGLQEGMTSIEGMRRLHEDVIAAFPDVALSFESETEVVSPYHSFAQRWASDYAPHPVSTYLMGDHEIFYGFLDQPAPDIPAFISSINKYEGQGIMPTIAVNSLDDLSDGLPVASRFLTIMRSWQDNAFRPDWGSDWTGYAFRYVSPDGSKTANVLDDGTRVQMHIGAQKIYERAKNVSSVVTSSFIPNWAAYDAASLYGLNPDSEYWLDPNVARPAEAVHLGALPANASLGLGTLATPHYGYFELNPITPAAYDFTAQFAGAKAGSDYLRLDYPLEHGASAQIGRVVIAGKLKQPALLMTPPFQVLGAATFVEYQVPIPAGRTTFTFGAGISDLGTRSDGVLFLIRINGNDAWSQVVPLGQLASGSLDLSGYSGQTIKLRLIVHPAHLNPVDDYAAWTDLTLTTVAPAAPVQFAASLPGANGKSVSSGTVQISPAANPTVVNAQVTLPAAFSLFADPPNSLATGGTLLDLAFDVWRKGYGGWAIPGAVSTTGKIQPVVSGGVLETAALPTIPPANGLTEITWGVQFPSVASKLRFRYGFADPSPPLPPVVTYTPVALTIRINGQSIWTKTINAGGWNDATVDVSAWAGTPVVFELDADGLGQGLFNWAHWAGLTVN